MDIRIKTSLAGGTCGADASYGLSEPRACGEAAKYLIIDGTQFGYVCADHVGNVADHVGNVVEWFLNGKQGAVRRPSEE